MATRSENPNWQIEHQCPQCGGPVILEETDRLFSCAYCRVRLYISSGDVLKYFIPSRLAHPDAPVYLPYWRYKGMVFSCTPSGVRSRVLDNTLLAADDSMLPPSMGIRPQVSRLKFLVPGSKGQFLKPRFDLKHALSAMEGQWKTLGDSALAGSTLHRDYIGETASLLFYPLAIRQGFLVDGLTREPIRPLAVAEAEALLSGREEPFCSLKFLPALCPDCGWDFLGERKSMVLFCRNCHGGWQPSGEGFRRISLVSAAGEGKNVLYLPFWRILAQTTGGSFPLSQDLDVMIPGLKGAGVKNQEGGFVFWFPAFKVHPDLFLRLAKKMTLEPFDGELSAMLPVQRVSAVTLPAEEAGEAIPASLAHMAAGKCSLQGVLLSRRWERIGTQLVLLPFQALGSELIQIRMNLAIQQNAVRYGVFI